MTNPSVIQARTVLIADMNLDKVQESIEAAIEYYRKVYGEPRRVWVNPIDVDNELTISDFKVERRGGCTRGHIMVM